MYEALFDYCFPVNFKEELRTQLSKSTQGKRNVRDFVREIKNVNERTVIQTFWNGLNQNIRIRLIEWDMSPEHTPLETIIRKAVSIENSDETLRREFVNISIDGLTVRCARHLCYSLDGRLPREVLPTV